MVIVANKSDLSIDSDLPYESLEATAIFDWENGYVVTSAKDKDSINKIFKELLVQAKPRFGVSMASCAGTTGHHMNSPLLLTKSRKSKVCIINSTYIEGMSLEIDFSQELVTLAP